MFCDVMTSLESVTQINVSGGNLEPSRAVHTDNGLFGEGGDAFLEYLQQREIIVQNILVLLDREIGKCDFESMT